MSVHQEKVASALARGVQSVLSRGLNDPRVRGLISVTDVRVSPDLSEATIRVSVMPGEHGTLAVHGLQHAAQHIRTEVGRMVRLRRMPRLAFRLDETLKRESEIIAAINAAVSKDRERATGPAGEPAAPGARAGADPGPATRPDPGPEAGPGVPGTIEGTDP